MTAVEKTRVWREAIDIPTYKVGQPDRNPMFLEKRVYQGSSGAVYPLPVIDQIEKNSQSETWNAVFLENEYLKIMLLPELGGRVQMALDKTNDYHFVYYNRVIKPALVGLAGPWISGGIEFNWPQHHRPGTYSPVDCSIKEHDDGSVTVWMHEIDRMYGTRGTHGIRLQPGRAVLEVHVRLSNRTSLPQTFLWWANPAIHVDEHHQSIFPPDVHAVMDHGKRDVSEFPIAKGTYYKVDYSPGTDISRYRNIPVPTSYMAYHSDYNFVGSYDHGRQAGLLHVADHHVSPGKKQWTWGCGEFGQAWDRQLTDEDGPYIELMCGVYTDNQPDFSWLDPGEEKQFVQNFMPYKGVGVVKNATVDAALGYEFRGSRICVKISVTSEFPQSELFVRTSSAKIGAKVVDLTPRQSAEISFELPPGTDQADIEIRLIDNQGRELVRCDTRPQPEQPIPSPAASIDEPATLSTVESICLAGAHLEQYRHATREPAEYYQEALRREPESQMANLALGTLLFRRGRFEAAETYLRHAIGTATRHSPNPASGTPHYMLGQCLLQQSRFDEAYNAFAKSAWNLPERAAAKFEMARITCRKGDDCGAIALLNDLLCENARHHQAIHLKTYLLTKLGRETDALRLAEEELNRDPFNFGVLFEVALANNDWSLFDERMRGELNNCLELSLDYARAGLYSRAASVIRHAVGQGIDSPLVWYYLAYFLGKLGHEAEARDALDRARSASLECCFPNKLSEIAILESAAAADPCDSRPPYLLGLLWYDRRQHDLAIGCWERSRALEPSFPTVWRNLGLAYFNVQGDGEAAWAAYEKAFSLDCEDARVLFELDQLAKRMGHLPEERLARLENNVGLVEKRDDLSLERITLLNRLGEHQQALELLLSREFRPWEGGEGKVPSQYVFALIAMARDALTRDRPELALERLAQADRWPESLGEGKLPGQENSQLQFFRGVALSATGDVAATRRAFQSATKGPTEVANPIFYNDQPPDHLFYQGLAWETLDEEQLARRCYESLIQYGVEHVDDEIKIDFFAVSLPDFLVFEDDLNRRNQAHCCYVRGLGKLGLTLLGDGDVRDAIEEFDRVLALAPEHIGAVFHRQLCLDPHALRLKTSKVALVKESSTVRVSGEDTHGT